jgi:hypothetical protein
LFTGIVEGFYGKPYSASQRDILLDYIKRLCNPSYVYAPKNDRYHRIDWRIPYPDETWSTLCAAMSRASMNGVHFVFAVSPWQFLPGEEEILRMKACRALEGGAAGIAVLFDDIPDTASPTLADMQIEFAERALRGTGCDITVCPSIYCIELMERLDGHAYLDAWRESCPAEWDIFWTGDEVISRELDEGTISRASELLGKKPVIWDNILADDYCLRRTFLGGLQGRTGSGLFSCFVNPSSIFPVALHAAMELVSAEGAEREWPAELGPHLSGWELLSEFHHLPWTPGETGAELLRRIEDGFAGRGEAEAVEWLGEAMDSLSELCSSLEGIEGGFDLMPLVLDLNRFFSIISRAMRDAEPDSRKDYLAYLLLERLPYEHPVALLARRLLDGNREVSG